MLIISKESAILKIRAPTRQRNQGLLTEPGTLVVFTIKKAGLRIYQSPAFSYYFLWQFFILTFSGKQKGKRLFYL
jgi:hypothetical protein